MHSSYDQKKATKKKTFKSKSESIERTLERLANVRSSSMLEGHTINWNHNNERKKNRFWYLDCEHWRATLVGNNYFWYVSFEWFLYVLRQYVRPNRPESSKTLYTHTIIFALSIFMLSIHLSFSVSCFIIRIG